MGLFSGFEHIVREREPLAPYTWFRLGGVAEYLAEPTSGEELDALVKRCREQEIPVRVLGGGSNLLVRDQGVPGLVDPLGCGRVFGNHRRPTTSSRPAPAPNSGHVISTAVREGLVRTRTAGRHPRHDRRSAAQQCRHREPRRGPMDGLGRSHDPQWRSAGPRPRRTALRLPLQQHRRAGNPARRALPSNAKTARN